MGACTDGGIETRSGKTSKPWGAFRKIFFLKTGRCEVGNMASEYNLPTKALSALSHLCLNIWLELIPAKTTIRPSGQGTPCAADQIALTCMRI